MADIPLNSEFDRVIEDPFAKVVYTWKKELLIVLVIGVLGAWGYSLIATAHETEKEAAAQAFLNVQRSYDEYVAAGDSKGTVEEISKKTEEAKKKFQAVLASFSDAGDTYKPLVDAYRAMANKATDINFATLTEGSPERLVAELSALAVARSQLDTDFDKGLSALKVIAHSGSAVTVAGALDSLIVVAPSDPEVIALEKSAVEKYPEIKAVLDKLAE
jgi:predicted negative regulator of RcsB-dependent stress response